MRSRQAFADDAAPAGARRPGVQRALRAALLGAAVLLPGGCVVLTPTEPYAPAPPRPAAEPVASGIGGPARATEPAPRAAARPGDPARPANPIGPLDLDRAIALALERNPEVAARAWEVAGAEARHDEALGDALPRLYGRAAYAHHLDPQRLLSFRGAADVGVFSRDIATGDLVLEVPLFTGGRTLSRIQAADLRRRAAGDALARHRRELTYAVTAVFYAIILQRHVIASVEQGEAALEAHRRAVQDLVEARKAARVDLLRTEVRLADVRRRLVGERHALAIARRTLATLMGWDGATVDVRGELAAPPDGSTGAGVAALPLDDAVAQALDQRADHRAARAALEADARAVDEARAGHWPAIAVQGSYGGRWAIAPDDRPDGAVTVEDVAQVGVVLDLPLFEGGRTGARIADARARLGAARERLRGLELRIREEVETALLAVGTAREQVAATRAAVGQAEESLRVEREKYAVGKGTVLDVLDAQAALLEVQTNHARALAELATSRAQVRLAIGADLNGERP